MTVVVDASVVVAALVDSSRFGEWAESVIAEHHLIAPQLVLIETLNVLRRLERNGVIEASEANEAITDLCDLPIQFASEVSLVEEIWVLRHNLTSYDATYLVLAASFDLPLATLDRKLAKQTGLCEFLVP